MDLFRSDGEALFRADSLSWVMMGLILFVVINVFSFSNRYLAGDKHHLRHRLSILLLAIAVIAMVFANHLLLLLACWAISNLLLISLMIHKSEWRAARNSGLLALKTLGFGVLLIGLGFALLAETVRTASISQIVPIVNEPSTTQTVALVLIAIGAMTQSAIWPFHRWLTSSLNSPTPVSALMHAGLVNGGGFLLVRFAPLYATQSLLLHGLFVAGLITAMVGTFWKLLQTDVKRMLACSTMGQMGFMLMQLGMGLFVPAISHLCWHGLFKAYLFLNVGSVVKEKNNRQEIVLSPLRYLFAGLAGLGGALTFALASGTSLRFGDTSSLMLPLAFMASTQLSMGLLSQRITVIHVIGSILIGAAASGLYGLNLRLIETALHSLPGNEPQPMDAWYIAGIGAIVLVWLVMILNLPARIQTHRLWKKLYMTALNASQPHPQTITASRTDYRS
ncbi:MAG: proton-conducting transporter membrane subunit [Gemmataceae bacterium]